MAAHTPGPWRVVALSVWREAVEIVAPAGEGDPVPIAAVWRDRRPGQRREDDANAQLIAEAPKLLAVLKAAREELTGADDSLKAARAELTGAADSLQAVLAILAEAIATAEGGS
jgi:hypothetical protein